MKINVGNKSKLTLDCEKQQIQSIVRKAKNIPVADIKVFQIFGKIPHVKKPIFVMWAKNPHPKKIYEIYCEISKIMFKEKLTVILDDITPKLLEGRSISQQQEVTKLIKAFLKEHDSNLIILSEKFNLLDYLKVISKIKLSHFMHFIPSHERNLQEITLLKIIHFTGNIYADYLGTNYGNLFLLGKSNIGRFIAFTEIKKKINNKDVSGIAFKINL